MKKHIYLIIAACIIAVLASCSPQKGPFTGIWETDFLDADEYFYFYAKQSLHLDLHSKDKIVYPKTGKAVLGLIYRNEEGQGYEDSEVIPIVKATVEGETAQIEYIHEITGDRWNATLHYDPNTKDITFVNGEMIERGPIAPDSNERTEFTDRIFCTEGDSTVLHFIGPLSNENDSSAVASTPEQGEEEVESPAYDETEELEETTSQSEATNRVVLADRVIYEGYDESGVRQLYCQFNGSEEAVTIVDEEGESILGFSYHVENMWPMADGKGVLLVRYDGGNEFMTLELIKLDAENRIAKIDEAFGVTEDNPFYEPGEITDDMIPSISKEGNHIKVFNPRAMDEDGKIHSYTHYYDMNGNRVK